MKNLSSFKASVSKMPAEYGQKEVGTNVSPGDFKRLERKANIAYLSAQNDIVQEVPKFNRASYVRREFEVKERQWIFI